MKRIAILDDYKDVARGAADWKSLPETEFTGFTEHIADEDALADPIRVLNGAGR